MRLAKKAPHEGSVGRVWGQAGISMLNQKLVCSPPPAPTTACLKTSSLISVPTEMTPHYWFPEILWKSQGMKKCSWRNEQFAVSLKHPLCGLELPNQQLKNYLSVGNFHPGVLGFVCSFVSVGFVFFCCFFVCLEFFCVVFVCVCLLLVFVGGLFCFFLVRFASVGWYKANTILCFHQSSEIEHNCSADKMWRHSNL